MNIWETIKSNAVIKTIVILVVVYIGYGIFNAIFGIQLLSLETPQKARSSYESTDSYSSLSMGSVGSTNSYPAKDYTPQVETQNRIVIQESNLSLLVRDVVTVRDSITKKAQELGGYMVSSQTSTPEEDANATVVVRVPVEKFEEALDYFRKASIKVVSENLKGKDVTDQYQDIETHIARLVRSQSKMEGLLDQATTFQEITNLTREVLSLQNQIDTLRGQQISLEQNASLVKITVYLSTDEISLPYTPSETFRPAVIFKLAVRSLIGSLRKIAALAIWVAVYSVIWIPAIIIYKVLKRKRANPSN